VVNTAEVAATPNEKLPFGVPPLKVAVEVIGGLRVKVDATIWPDEAIEAVLVVLG
jgi:hypothetical protein